MSDNESDADDGLEKWREQTETGSRIDEEARGRDPYDYHEQVAEATAAAFGEMDKGEIATTITFYDDGGKALLVGIEDVDGFDRLSTLLSDHDRTEATVEATRSSIMRALVRVALAEVDPKLLDAGREGKARRSDDPGF